MGVVALTGLYLVGLGVSTISAPAVATRFLLGFAGTARTHLLEMGVRMVVGIAFIVSAPRLPRPDLVAASGWVLCSSTAVLVLVPWRWHRRFAERFVPPVTRHIRIFGLASFGLGGLVLWAVLRGAGRL